MYQIEKAITKLCQSLFRECGLEVHNPLVKTEDKSSAYQVGFPRELKLMKAVALDKVMTI